MNNIVKNVSGAVLWLFVMLGPWICERSFNILDVLLISYIWNNYLVTDWHYWVFLFGGFFCSSVISAIFFAIRSWIMD